MEIVIIEKQEFASLLKRHHKVINIMEFLIHTSRASNPMEMQFNAEDVCSLFKMTKQDLREARMEGKIRSYSFNDRIYYTASDVIDFIEKRDNIMIDKKVRQIAVLDTILKRPRGRPRKKKSEE